MASLETVGSTSQSLAQRMAKGRIPVQEALRYAMILADSLRKIHESGQAHGAVTPACIVITRTGLDLLPALGSAGVVTPYTAPEVVQGKPADSRSDIFSFGAILYEMLTGRAPFQAEDPAALASGIVNSVPPPSGSPAVDRLVAGCIAKDPSVRYPKVQKLILELKLLSVAVRHRESANRPQPEDALRAEVREIEAKILARLERNEQSLDAVNERLARMEQLMQASAERAERIEQAVEIARHDNTSLRESVAEDLSLFERSLKSQAASIESARTAMSQTDDLVERVVEALESLQSVVLENTEEQGVALT